MISRSEKMVLSILGKLDLLKSCLTDVEYEPSLKGDSEGRRRNLEETLRLLGTLDFLTELTDRLKADLQNLIGYLQMP